MVLQKRLDYGFNGYQVPAMPRASRSARGRGAHRRKVADNQMFAFDLLATVAGKLLQESENSPSPSDSSAKKKKPSVVNDMIKQEQEDEQRPLKEERYDQGSCDESVFGCHGKNQNCAWKELTHAQNVSVGGVSSITSYSDGSEKIDSSEKHLAIKSKNEFGRFPSKVVGGSPGYGESMEGKVEDISQRQLEVKPWNISSLKNDNLPDMCCSRDPMELDRKPPALVSSDSSVEEPLCRHHNPSVSFPGHQDDVKLATRDDDENSSGCTQPSTTIKTTRPPPRIGDRRIRKLLASKYWKVAPKLNDGEFSNTDGLMTLSYHNRKTFYTRQRSQRNSPHKRRKLIDQSSVSTSGICNLTEKFTNRDASGSSAKKLEASAASSSVAGQQKSFQSRDSHVKLSIKSFRIPELFIEIPETATVGSLKRTVMEAVTAILGGGLRVGVLLQGKKVRDDNKTLLQTGISHDNKLDTLGFTLEPNTAQTPTSVCHEDPPFLLPSEEPQPLTRHPAAPALDPENSEASPDTRLNDVGNYVESDHDSVPSPADVSNDKTTSDSRALVAIPTMSVEALAVVPLHRKSRRSELVQRRIRRPFSVLEVEALVQAVEKLGTGRWRDVKLRAFDNAKHRTYVDLKDKWKTLVHTARISPQQRRGEPVPQELLDRVLSAHAYWSQQQAKQQVKQQSETCLLL